MPTPWAKHTKTTIKGTPSLGNPSCSKSDFSPPLAVAVAVAVAVAAQPDHPLLRATSRAHPYAAAVAMAVWWLYGRLKDDHEVIMKLPPVRNIIIVYLF